jgi:hypothetical protein
MRRLMLAATLVLVMGLTLFPMNGEAQMGRGMIGGGTIGSQGGYGQGNYCPYCGSYIGPGYGMGPGMMYGRPGMGPGMMYRDWDRSPQYGPQFQQPQKSLEVKDVKEMLDNYLKSTRNPNLKLGNIEDKGVYFEAEILTKDNSLADKIAVDKTTGWMRSIY